MPKTQPQTNQLVSKVALQEIGAAADAAVDEILQKIAQTLRDPVRISASATPDSKVNITASLVQVGNGSGKTLSPLGSSTPSFVASTIDLQTAATTGGTINATFPATTIGQYRRAAFTLLSNGTVDMTFSGPVVSLGSLGDAALLYSPGGIPMGYIDLEATASTAFKTAGSATSIVENAVGGVPRIVNVAGAGGGGSASPAVAAAYVRAGRFPVPQGVSFVDIVFDVATAADTYVPVVSWLSADANKQFMAPSVDEASITVNGFRVEWNAETLTANNFICFHTLAPTES